MNAQTPERNNEHIAFIGGGNMASAIIGGLLKRGLAASQIQVVEPFAEQRARLSERMPAATLRCRAAWTCTRACPAASLKVWGLTAQMTMLARASEASG